MAIIGTFQRGDDGALTGVIKTLTLSIKARLAPIASNGNDKAPDLRVMVGGVEIGAGWKRTSRDANDYFSLKLDDPSFPAPIYANLCEAEDDGGFNLIWSR